MKFLHTTILSAIFLKNVIASDPNEFKLAKGVGDDMRTAIGLYEQHLQLQNELINHMINGESPELIVGFIKQTDQIDDFGLAALYANGSEAVIAHVHKEIEFSQNDMIYVASDLELVCHPVKFIALLGKITTSNGQEAAIEGGIAELVSGKRTSCMNPLLTALKGKEFLSKRLEDVAVQTAFMSGAVARNKSLINDFYDHPAITPKVYADVLLTPGLFNVHDPSFRFLLETADQDDLRMVQNGYKRKSSNFRATIKYTMSTAKPGGFRLGAPVRRAEIAKETFKGLGHPGVPEDVADYLIDPYVTGSDSHCFDS